MCQNHAKHTSFPFNVWAFRHERPKGFRKNWFGTTALVNFTVARWCNSFPFLHLVLQLIWKKEYFKESHYSGEHLLQRCREILWSLGIFQLTLKRMHLDIRSRSIYQKPEGAAFSGRWSEGNVERAFGYLKFEVEGDRKRPEEQCSHINIFRPARRENYWSVS